MTTTFERRYGSHTSAPRSRFLPRRSKTDHHSSSSRFTSSTSLPTPTSTWRNPRYVFPVMARPKKLCTIEDLTRIITAPCNGYYEIPTDPYNEVYPGILISDGTTAMCTGLLRRLGVTHVLNAAMGKNRNFNLINTNPTYYKDSGIQFYGIEAIDTTSFKLERYFEEGADFIEKALASGGKVLVHCREGISRSATMVLSFLMIKRNLTAQEAVRVVRARREIIPNDGFLLQLCELNEKLYSHEKRNTVCL